MHLRAKKLADRFEGAIVRRMAQGNERGAPTEPLFHYTTADALLAIIGSETFWFTSVYHMDDEEELSFGFGISHSLLSAAMEREDLHVKTFLKPLVEDVGFDRIKNRFEFYSASFGQKDDPLQWTDYADGGKGVALGLAPKFFSIVKSGDFKPEEKIFLGKVEYGEPSAKIRHAAVVDSAVETVRQAHKQGLLLKVKDEGRFLHLMAAEMYVEILWNSVTTKADNWSHQAETRLLAVNDLTNPGIEIKNAPKRPRVEIPQPLLKANITEIMMGPEADDDSRARVRQFLHDNGLERSGDVGRRDLAVAGSIRPLRSAEIKSNQPADGTSSLSPIATICSTPSGSGRCSARPGPTARASRHRALLPLLG